MKKSSNLSRVMETENHLKNRTNPKSQTSRKKLLPGAILMCLLWAIPLMANAQTWQIGSNVTATLSSGTLTISGTGDMASYSSDNQPWYSQRANINALVIQSGVTSISAQAFNNCTNLQTVTIEDGTVALRFVGSYGYGHFTNSPIETLYLGRDLETAYIGGDYSNGSPFNENTALQSLTIGKDVTTINDNSFQNCTGLQSLTVGIAIITIGNNAFYNCSRLAGALTIPNKVKTIGSGAFQGCRVLPSVSIPNSVTSIGSQAFNGCTNLQTVSIEDGTVTLRFVGSYGYGHFTNSPIETLHLGRDLETAYIGGDYSNGSPFNENTALQSLIIGKDVTTINDNSFQNCTRLTGITIPSNITSIGSSAFSGCRFKEIHSKNPNPPSAVDGCFSDMYATCKLYVPIGSGKAYETATEWIKFFDNGNGFEENTNGIDKVLTDQLSIFPNPVINELFIKSELPVKKVEIYSQAGSLLIQENNFTEKISVSALPKGVYLLKVYTGKSMAVSKFVKE